MNSKREKTPVIAGLFFVFLFSIIIGVFSFTLIGQKNLLKNFFKNKIEAPSYETQILDITEEVIKDSSFIEPLTSIVKRDDESFSFALVESGILDGDRFVGEIDLTYPNNEDGTISEDREEIMELFLTKKGDSEKVSIIDRLIGGLKMPNGSIVPIKFTDANIVDGKLVGKFRFLILSGSKQVVGEFSELDLFYPGLSFLFEFRLYFH